MTRDLFCYPYRLRAVRVGSALSCSEVINGIQNKGVDSLVSYGRVFGCLLYAYKKQKVEYSIFSMQCFVSLFLAVSTSVIDCLERLISEMTGYVLSGTLNPTHSLATFFALMILTLT